MKKNFAYRFLQFLFYDDDYDDYDRMGFIVHCIASTLANLLFIIFGSDILTHARENFENFFVTFCFLITLIGCNIICIIKSAQIKYHNHFYDNKKWWQIIFF